METLTENPIGEKQEERKGQGQARVGDAVRAVLPRKSLIVTSIPLGLLVLYLTVIGPSNLPLPANLEPSFPAATRVLSDVCVWCAANWLWVVVGAVALLFGNVLVRLQPSRYYGWLTIVSALALCFTYYSVSAPIERLFKAVKEEIPQDRRTQLR